MTSIEWLIDQLPIRIVNQYMQEIDRAKKMHNQELFEFWEGGINCTEEGGKSFEEYHKEKLKNNDNQRK